MRTRSTVKTNKVRPKKFLGQHFLHDQPTAIKIVEALTVDENNTAVLEIGPGMGVLTKYLVQNENIDLKLIEIDRDSIKYLHEHFPLLRERTMEGDFLAMDLKTLFPGRFSIIGNFPYNISSQIFFKALEHRDSVSQIVCMLQKEVAERMAAKHGNKTYGILSVLLQAYYNIELLFKVSPGVFTPPPNVMSAVIRLQRNGVESLACNEELFKKVVKQGFNYRRKTLRNALKNFTLPVEILSNKVFDLRAEQLSVQDFVNLTQLIEESRGAGSI